MKTLRIAALSLSCLGPTGLIVSTAALAQTSNSPPAADNAGTPSALSGWMFGYAPFDWHFSDARKENDFEPDEQKHAYVWLIQAEKELDKRHIAGFAYFKNSFGQPSQYAYYGWRFRPFDSAPGLFIKLTGGIIHGYKFPFNKKIPLNNKHGWGITAIPALGYDFNRNWGAQVNVLGNAGVMFQLNYTVR
ncbi:hypothetical protein [Comamonas sp. 26]|uniref:hypothetical protein n=1 Tax=Comamonas sp. 26 TaxID=2035201 RepID=UPI000C1A5C1D|nr:hypothetical protein [Comamonas sp. 26]PIG07553.1 hypothetical protein CLU84_0373 [Comamonas sp. 26]